MELTVVVHQERGSFWSEVSELPAPSPPVPPAA
jgi:hypothetical protein